MAICLSYSVDSNDSAKYFSSFGEAFPVNATIQSV